MEEYIGQEEIQIENNYVPTATQEVAHRAVQRYKLFGGAMGGGKTRWLCEEVKDLVLRYPGNRVIMARYHLSDFKNSTLKTLLECLPQELVRNHNQADHTIYVKNGSEIIYMGMAEEQNISKIKSMEIGAFALDEASEIPKEQFLLLQSRLRRRLPSGVFPPYYGLLATNPDDCWLKDDFVLGGGGTDYIFIPSLPRDNPYLPEDYEDMLRKSYPEDWVKIFLEGSWEDLVAGDTVLSASDIRMAVNRELVVVDKPIVSSDIARFGDDEIVLQYANGNCLMEQDISVKKSLMETVGRIINMRKKYNARLLVVDDAALGGGVTDRLREMKEKVLAINGGNKAINELKFANLKSEMWWYAREQFKKGLVSIINDPILIRQLGAVKYLYRSNGKIMIEPKKEVKKRLGRSPDRADTLIQLLWGAKFIRDPAIDFRRRGRVNLGEKVNMTNDYGWNYYTQEVING